MKILQNSEIRAKQQIAAVFRLVKIICGALRYLVPSAQFKKREKKKQWRSVNFSKVAG